MLVILLLKEQQTRDTTIAQFHALGHARGHTVRLLDKQAFLASDLRGVDVVCLKSHVDDAKVWKLIDSTGMRAVNRPLMYSDRSRLDAMLRDAGVRTPRSSASAAELTRLGYPIVRKSNSLLAAGDIRILHEPPLEIDGERYFYQQLIESDGATRKVYCIGAEAFLVKEFKADSAAQGEHQDAHRQQLPIPALLAETARNVGRLLGLEVYGLDFVGRGDEMFLIDVNPSQVFVVCRARRRHCGTIWNE